MGCLVSYIRHENYTNDLSIELVLESYWCPQQAELDADSYFPWVITSIIYYATITVAIKSIRHINEKNDNLINNLNESVLVTV